MSAHIPKWFQTIPTLQEQLTQPWPLTWHLTFKVKFKFKGRGTGYRPKIASAHSPKWSQMIASLSEQLTRPWPLTCYKWSPCKCTSTDDPDIALEISQVLLTAPDRPPGLCGPATGIEPANLHDCRLGGRLPRSLGHPATTCHMKGIRIVHGHRPTTRYWLYLLWLNLLCLRISSYVSIWYSSSVLP